MNQGNEMNESEKNIPDDFWRKAFDEAAETPPPRVWDAIERRLDESDGPKVLPLWGSGLALSRPLGWVMGMAAAVALLVVGWWAINTHSDTQPVARMQPINQTGNVAMKPVTPAKPSAQATSGQPTETIASGRNQPSSITSTEAPLASVTRQKSVPSMNRQPEIAMAQRMSKPVPMTQGLNGQSMVSGNMPSFSRSAASVDPVSPGSRITAVTAYSYDHQTAGLTSAATAAEAAVFNRLAGRPLRFRTPGPIQRIVWYQPADQPLEPDTKKSQHKSREMWASVSMMPGAFDPQVAVRSSQVAYANTMAASLSNSNQSTVASRASFSVAYQAGAGVQLTERWSVESGIGYLAGHSTVETPAQSVVSNSVSFLADRIGSTPSSNLYVDALRNSSTNKNANIAYSVPTNNLVTNTSYNSQTTYNAQTRQVLANNYQYMQVPVQIGYQLRPRKRLSMAVLGGLLTNIFVRNTVGNEVEITTKDGVYRPVSLAAIMGARFRYRPTNRWSASLAGLYEPSLGLGTQTDSQVQIRPTSTGMSFGLDYHF